MKLNNQIFHDFFYSGNDYQAGKSATKYTRGHFFSYATEIGHIYHAPGELVLFIADSNFSRTTAGHISALHGACPFTNVVEVPFVWGDDFTNREDMPAVLKKRFLEELTEYPEKAFSRKENREYFNRKLYNFRKFLKVTGQCITLKERRVLAKLEEAAQESPEAKAKRAEAARKRAEKTRLENRKKKEELKNALAGFSVSSLADKAKLAWGVKTAPETTPEIRAKLRLYLAKEYPCYSFIWLDGDVIKTSQCVTVDIITARRVYHLYTAGKLAPGMHCGPYSIREITADYVQIGCHRIAMENINDISGVLQNENN